MYRFLIVVAVLALPATAWADLPPNSTYANYRWAVIHYFTPTMQLGGINGYNDDGRCNLESALATGDCVCENGFPNSGGFVALRNVGQAVYGRCADQMPADAEIIAVAPVVECPLTNPGQLSVSSMELPVCPPGNGVNSELNCAAGSALTSNAGATPASATASGDPLPPPSPPLPQPFSSTPAPLPPAPPAPDCPDTPAPGPSNGATTSTTTTTTTTTGFQPGGIAVGTGRYVRTDPDLAASAGIGFSRSYSTGDKYTGLEFGAKWRHSWQRWIRRAGDGGAIANRPSGQSIFFDLVGADGSWAVRGPGVALRLVSPRDGDGNIIGWELYLEDGSVERYDAWGRLERIDQPTGRSLRFSHSVAATEVGQPPEGLLIAVDDDSGHRLELTYNSALRVESVTTEAGATVSYGYDNVGNLVSAVKADGGNWSYAYGDAQNPNNLTSVTDPQGTVVESMAYQADGRITSHTPGSGAPPVTLSYGYRDVTVTDAGGEARTYQWEKDGYDRYYIQAVVGTPCPTCGPKSATFNGTGDVSSATDWRDTRTDYFYDGARGLETKRVEAVGTPVARTITTEWHPTIRQKVRVAMPYTIVSRRYADDGEACALRADGQTPISTAVCEVTVEATDDATGAQGFAATRTGPTRTYAYTYDSAGRVLTMDGPRTDVTDVMTFAYYPDTDTDTGRAGRLYTVTNALGHTVTVHAYTLEGLVETIEDENGLFTEFVWDDNGHLIAIDAEGEVTTWERDALGRVTKVTGPDGVTRDYRYDTQGRVVSLIDASGAEVVVHRDARGFVTGVDVVDALGEVVKTDVRASDPRGLVTSITGGRGYREDFAYDGMGALIEREDALGRIASSAVDALGRPIHLFDNAGSARLFSWDARDALAEVVDAAGATTRYQRDGLGNLVSVDSDDSGLLSFAHDGAGNVISSTDANGDVTTYTWDALNRPLTVSYADGRLHTFEWDTGTYGKGRLAAVSEMVVGETARTEWRYDRHGRILEETQLRAGRVATVSYGYDQAGRLASVTYPSGRVVTREYDGAGQVARVATAHGTEPATVVENVVYAPFGSPLRWTLGNGQTVGRTIDLDGLVSAFTLGGVEHQVAHDPVGRVSGVLEQGGVSRSFTYDDLDRLTTSSGGTVDFAFAWDGAGDLVERSSSLGTETFTLMPGTHQIESLSESAGEPRAFIDDARGLLTSDGVRTFAYDARRRLVSVSTTSGATTYDVDAQGRVVRRTGPEQDVVMSYDVDGRLLSESDPEGRLFVEHIYLGDIPVGVVR